MRTLLLCALLFMAAAASSGGLLDVVDRVEGQVTLSLSFDGARVQEGAALRPNVTRSAPAVTFDGTTLGAFYTLMEVDPDAPDPANPQLRSYLHCSGAGHSRGELWRCGRTHSGQVPSVDAARGHPPLHLPPFPAAPRRGGRGWRATADAA